MGGPASAAALTLFLASQAMGGTAPGQQLEVAQQSQPDQYAISPATERTGSSEFERLLTQFMETPDPTAIGESYLVRVNENLDITTGVGGTGVLSPGTVAIVSELAGTVPGQLEGPVRVDVLYVDPVGPAQPAYWSQHDYQAVDSSKLTVIEHISPGPGAAPAILGRAGVGTPEAFSSFRIVSVVPAGMTDQVALLVGTTQGRDGTIEDVVVGRLGGEGLYSTASVYAVGVVEHDLHSETLNGTFGEAITLSSGSEIGCIGAVQNPSDSSIAYYICVSNAAPGRHLYLTPENLQSAVSLQLITPAGGAEFSRYFGLDGLTAPPADLTTAYQNLLAPPAPESQPAAPEVPRAGEDPAPAYQLNLNTQYGNGQTSGSRISVIRYDGTDSGLFITQTRQDAAAASGWTASVADMAPAYAKGHMYDFVIAPNGTVFGSAGDSSADIRIAIASGPGVAPTPEAEAAAGALIASLQQQNPGVAIVGYDSNLVPDAPAVVTPDPAQTRPPAETSPGPVVGGGGEAVPGAEYRGIQFYFPIRQTDSIYMPSTSEAYDLGGPMGRPAYAEARNWGPHEGIDLHMRPGTVSSTVEIVAAAGGTVIEVWPGEPEGTCTDWPECNSQVIIDHGNGVYSMYVHLNIDSDLVQGQWVDPGQVIGTIGRRGATSISEHLHFNLVDTNLPGSDTYSYVLGQYLNTEDPTFIMSAPQAPIPGGGAAPAYTPPVSPDPAPSGVVFNPVPPELSGLPVVTMGADPWLQNIHRFPEIPGAIDFSQEYPGSYPLDATNSVSEYVGACYTVKTVRNVIEFQKLLAGTPYLDTYIQVESFPALEVAYGQGDPAQGIPRNYGDESTNPRSYGCAMFNPVGDFGNVEGINAWLLTSGINLDTAAQLAREQGIPLQVWLAVLYSENPSGGAGLGQVQGLESQSGIGVARASVEHLRADADSFGGPQLMYTSGPENNIAEALLAYNRGRTGAHSMIDQYSALGGGAPAAAVSVPDITPGASPDTATPGQTATITPGSGTTVIRVEITPIYAARHEQCLTQGEACFDGIGQRYAQDSDTHFADAVVERNGTVVHGTDDTAGTYTIMLAGDAQSNLMPGQAQYEAALALAQAAISQNPGARIEISGLPGFSLDSGNLVYNPAAVGGSGEAVVVAPPTEITPAPSPAPDAPRSGSDTVPVATDLRYVRVGIHYHTDASDGFNSMQQMVDAAHQAGFEAIIITDHNVISADVRACQQYASQQYGMACIPGVEISTTAGEVNAIGIDPALYDSLPTGQDLPAVVQWVHDHGGIVIGNHPQIPGVADDQNKYAAPDELVSAGVDYVECNLQRGDTGGGICSDPAFSGIPQIFGSDAHNAVGLGQHGATAMIVSLPEGATPDDLNAAILSSLRSRQYAAHNQHWQTGAALPAVPEGLQAGQAPPAADTSAFSQDCRDQGFAETSPGMCYGTIPLGNGATAYVVQADLDTPGISFGVSPPRQIMTPRQYMDAHPEVIAAINGDFFNSEFQQAHLAVSDGQVYPGYDGHSDYTEPCFLVLNDGRRIISPGGFQHLDQNDPAVQAVRNELAGISLGDIQYAICGLPLSGPSGEVHPYVAADTRDAYTQGNYRTALAYNDQTGVLTMIVVDWPGVSFQGMAELIRDRGYGIGIMLDGGGSSQQVVAEGGVPVTQNTPSPPWDQRGVGAPVERPVSEMVYIYRTP